MGFTAARNVDWHAHFRKQFVSNCVQVNIPMSCDPANPFVGSTPEKLGFLMEIALFLTEKIKITQETKKLKTHQ